MDGRLWFFITNGELTVYGRYLVIPSNTLFIQSFSIPQGEFFIGKNNFLLVGTLSNNSYENNTICLRKTGYAFESKIENNTIDDTINTKWRGSEIGIAFSYIVFSNGKNVFIYLLYLILVFLISITAETEKTSPPSPDIG